MKALLSINFQTDQELIRAQEEIAQSSRLIEQILVRGIQIPKENLSNLQVTIRDLAAKLNQGKQNLVEELKEPTKRPTSVFKQSGEQFAVSLNDSLTSLTGFFGELGGLFLDNFSTTSCC